MNDIYLQWNSPCYLMNDWTWISLIHTSSDLKQEKANVTAGMKMRPKIREEQVCMSTVSAVSA